MVSLKHKFHSPKTDGPDSTVAKPSDWNNEHDLTTTAQGIVLGRDTSGSGDIQELPLAIDPDGTVHMTGGALELPAGPSSERPAPPAAGMIRYNEELAVVEVYIGGQWVPVAIGAGTVPVGGTVGWYSNQAPTGWLFVNGQKIGDGASGADHANDLYQALFTFLWNSVASCKASVSGGPGATPAADWTAHKTMVLPDECGRVAAGANNMGGIASTNRMTISGGGVDGDTLGATGGVETILQTKNMMPDHTHAGTGAGGSAGSGGGSGIPVTNGQPVTGGVSGYGPQINTPITQPTMIKNVIIKY